MATEIASAYVSLIPSFKGGAAAISSELGGPSVDAGKEAGGKFGGAFSGAFGGILKAGALLGGLALVTDVLQQSITQADLPGTLRSQFALSEADAATAAKAAGDVYAAGFGESLTAVGTTAGNVQKALNDLGTTGDLGELTTQAQVLADKFGEDVSSNINAASQLVKTGLAPNLDSAFDILTAGFQSNANAGQDFLDTVTEYSVQFQALGLDGASALGLINQGLEAGARNSDLVADALKEFNLRATEGGAEASAAFESMGLNAADMTAAIAGGGDGAAAALDQTLDALRGIEDPVARDAAAVALFGTQAEDLGDSLYALDPSEAASKIGDVAGAADKLTSTKSASQSITALGRSFKSGLAEAITPLIPLLSGLMDFLMPLLPILAPLAIAIGVVTAAQWLWNAALLANPIGLIIAAVIAAAALIIIYWDDIIAGLTAAWEWLVSLATSVWSALVDFFTGLWDSIMGGITAAWDWIVNFFNEWWPLILGIATGGIGLLVGLIVDNWDAIVEFTISTWNSIVDFFVGIWEWIAEKFETGVNNVMAFFGKLAQLRERAAEWFGRMKDAAIEKFQSLVSWAKSLPGKVLDALGNVGNKLKSAGGDLISGLLNGMKGGINAVYDWVTGMLGNVKDQVLDFFGIHSPSRLMMWVGEMVVSGFGLGMERETPSLTAAADAMTTAAVPDTSALAGTGGASGGDTFNVTIQAADNRFSLDDLKRQIAMQVG